MNRHLSSRLAAHANARQVQASILADRAAAVVDRAAGTIWGSLLRALRKRPFNAYAVTAHHIRELVPTLARSIDAHLNRLAIWGHRQTVAAMRDTLPMRYLRAGTAAHLFEEDRVVLPDPQRQPGSVTLALGALGLEPVDVPDEEPASAEMDDEQQRAAFLGLLFPPPTLEETEAIVYAPVQGRTWQDRLEGATRTSASPSMLASTVAIGFSQGKTAQEIARQLLPIVDGVRSTARRIARTESLRVSHEVQMQAWEGLGDLCVGFQIHATLDQNTRPEHAARNGTIYYKEPTGNQAGLDEMPRPPLEANGVCAWSCRCHLSPVLTANRDVLDDPDKLAVFTTAEDKLVPDPLTYSQWFDRAPQQHRETAVGVRRYRAVAAQGGVPSWEAFLDPDTGSVMPLNRLQDETTEERARRVLRVRQQMQERRELLRKVAMMGWA